MSEAKLCYKLTLHSQEEFDEVVSVVDELAEQFSISHAVSFKLTLALDEVVSNIFNYAFSTEDFREVIVIVCVVGEHFFAKISDKGTPFDVSQIEEPELEKPIDERKKPVGGMGIHLVRKMMDSFTYYRHEDINTVIICSKIV